MRRIARSLIHFFRHTLFTVKVEGESGWPLLVPGKYYLASGLLKPQAGDFIAFHNPLNFGEIFVKRVEEIVSDRYRVDGLISWSSSSRNFGLVKKNLIIGKLFLRG